MAGELNPKRRYASKDRSLSRSSKLDTPAFGRHLAVKRVVRPKANMSRVSPSPIQSRILNHYASANSVDEKKVLSKRRKVDEK